MFTGTGGKYILFLDSVSMSIAFTRYKIPTAVTPIVKCSTRSFIHTVPIIMCSAFIYRSVL